MKTVTLNRKQLFEIRRELGEGTVNLLCYSSSQLSSDRHAMKIEQIEIKNIGGIPYLKLENLDPQMNIICGENGVGKTNILNSLAFCYSRYTYANMLSKRVNTDYGEIELQHSGYVNSKSVRRVEASSPHEMIGNYDQLPSRLAIYLQLNRVFNYAVQSSIERDPDPDEYDHNILNGAQVNNLKNWFISRELHGKAGNLNHEQNYNIDLARKFVSILNDEFSFKQSTTSNEIIIKTPTGEVLFEYLSSGFKSIFFILVGILKEIEYKNGEKKLFKLISMME